MCQTSLREVNTVFHRAGVLRGFNHAPGRCRSSSAAVQAHDVFPSSGLLLRKGVIRRKNSVRPMNRNGFLSLLNY